MYANIAKDISLRRGVVRRSRVPLGIGRVGLGRSHRPFQPLLVALGSRYDSSAPPPPPPKGTGSKPPPSEEGAQGEKSHSFGGKVSQAWRTPTKWYPIPIALGALVLLAVQYRKQTREIEVESQREGGAVLKKTVDGPWQVRVLGALPLRSLSQLWGYLNSLVLPMWFRPTGFRLYSWIFGCNLDECTPEDLHAYESLGEFFYRELKPGMRPIADAPMVSPADGRVLHYGEIVEERVEQVKGITYSLQALLGQEGSAYGDTAELPAILPLPESESGDETPPQTPRSRWKRWTRWFRRAPKAPGSLEEKRVVDDRHFAEINDIPYSMTSLMGISGSSTPSTPDGKAKAKEKPQDASISSKTDLSHDASVALSMGTSAIGSVSDGENMSKRDPNHRLYFFVVYLAPGDYHRFHSPVAWIVERRRHFTGDLFSVSPYIANRLKDLFVLNERVALLGRWKYGFYSMTPVGATNVGSIRINFDEKLRTNTRKLSHPPHTFTEAVYASASILQGQPLLPGEEMGGFRLGSTIVLVFEAPKNWKWDVKAGDKVKMGEALGHLEEQKEDMKERKRKGRWL